MELAPILILAGAVLIAFGRKLFWLFVGVVGFASGMYCATHFFNVNPEWALWVIAVGMGLVGTLFAFFLQKIAIGISGFLVGGFLSMNIGEMFGWQGDIKFRGLFFLSGGLSERL